MGALTTKPNVRYIAHIGSSILCIAMSFSPAFGQSPSCDDPVLGSGACLPWGTTIVPGLPGEISGLSADGSVIVGATSDAVQTFRWKLGEGVKLFTVPDSSRSEPPSDRQAISANGAVIVGEARLPMEPFFLSRIFRWDADADTHILLPSGPSTEAIRFIVPTPPSTYVLTPGEDTFFNPEDNPSISADGNTIVGTGGVQRFENGMLAGILAPFAFQWTASGGTTDAPQIPFTERLTPHSVSGDGLTVIGEARPSIGSEFSVVTTSGAAQTVVSTSSAPTAVSHAGTNVAGESKVTPFPGYRWTIATGAIGLTNTLLPRSISDDGNTITSLNRNPGPPFAFSEPWVWDPVNGERWMQQMIANDYGLNLLAYGIRDPVGIVSGDGNVFTMGGSNSVAKITPIEAVFLGDSYSSGEGVPNFEAGTDVDGTNECHRSLDAYSTLTKPRSSILTLTDLANSQPGFAWKFLACSGAETRNVRATLDPPTTLGVGQAALSMG